MQIAIANVDTDQITDFTPLSFAVLIEHNITPQW